MIARKTTVAAAAKTQDTVEPDALMETCLYALTPAR